MQAIKNYQVHDNETITNKQSMVATLSWKMATQMPPKRSLVTASDSMPTSVRLQFIAALTEDIKHASHSARLSDCIEVRQHMAA